MRCMILALGLLSVPPAYGQGWIEINLSSDYFAGPNDSIQVDYFVRFQCPWEDWDEVVVDYVEWESDTVGYSEEGSFWDGSYKDKYNKDYNLVAHCYCTDWLGIWYSDEFEVYGGATAQFTNPTNYLLYNGEQVAFQYDLMLNDPNQACALCGTVGRVRVPIYRQTFVGYDAWDEPGEGTYFENEINYSPGNCACSGMGPPDPTGFGEGGEFYFSGS